MKIVNTHRDTGFSSVKMIFALLLAAAGLLILSGSSYADMYGKKLTCGSDALCQSLEGKEFDMILYSVLGSELVVIYDRSVTGEIKIAMSKGYREEKGTVLDAVHYLSKVSEYRTFTVSKAIKSVGWFGSERIEGMYIVKPIYEYAYPHAAGEYALRERDGMLELRIKPVYSFDDN